MNKSFFVPVDLGQSGKIPECNGNLAHPPCPHPRSPPARGRWFSQVFGQTCAPGLRVFKPVKKEKRNLIPRYGRAARLSARRTVSAQSGGHCSRGDGEFWGGQFLLIWPGALDSVTVLLTPSAVTDGAGILGKMELKSISFSRLA